MSNTKHTHQLAPWKLEQQTTGDITVIGADGVRLALVTVADYPRQQSNANLIAAAPDLLEALKDIFALMDEGILVRDISNDHKPDWSIKALKLTQILKTAYDAIAKAQGGGK